MIQIKPLGEARVLIVGRGILVAKVAQDLINYGVSVFNITVVDSSVTVDEKGLQTITRDPEEFIQTDRAFFLSFDIVLSADQPRSFEIALSNLRWPENATMNDPDLPIIVMRSVDNRCKMRCQYRELQVNGSVSSKYISLPMDLPPWTDEKHVLVASIIRQEFKPEQNLTFLAYLLAGRIVVDFQELHGSWPSSKDTSQLVSKTYCLGSDFGAKTEAFINLFCEQGFAAADETTTILSRLVASDTVKLLSGSGQPINHTNIEEVILAATRNLV